MKVKKMTKNKFAVIIEKDEMIMAQLTTFAINEAIGLAEFRMIGSLTNITLGYLDNKKNDYIWQTFNENWELLLATGTISWNKTTKQPVIHCHISIANNEYKVRGGHLQDAKIGIKAEVIIVKLSDEKIFQVIDKKSNFTMWDI